MACIQDAQKPGSISGLEAGVCEVGEPGTLQGDELLAVVAQTDQGCVRQVGAVGDAEIPEQSGGTLIGPHSLRHCALIG